MSDSCGTASLRHWRFTSSRLGISRWLALPKLAGLALEEFIELLAEAGVDAVDYAPEELRTEIEAAR